MAKKRKSFKSLPKRSKAAAFAKMSTAGKLKKKDKQGKRTGAAISAKGASKTKPKAKVTAKPKVASKERKQIKKLVTGKANVSGVKALDARGQKILSQIKTSAARNQARKEKEVNKMIARGIAQKKKTGKKNTAFLKKYFDI